MDWTTYGLDYRTWWIIGALFFVLALIHPYPRLLRWGAATGATGLVLRIISYPFLDQQLILLFSLYALLTAGWLIIRRFDRRAERES